MHGHRNIKVSLIICQLSARTNGVMTQNNATIFPLSLEDVYMTDDVIKLI